MWRPGSRLLFPGVATTLLLAFILGGGQGWAGERLLALPALVLMGFAVHAMERGAVADGSAAVRRSFYLLPLLLCAWPALQLLPLPDALWRALPGRADLAAALAAAGVAQDSGRWSLAPADTERILLSLLVPVGIFMACCTLSESQQRHLLEFVLVLAAASAVLGLLQRLQGADSALYFYTFTNRGSAVGWFANRNHLASLLAASLPVAVGLLADTVRAESIQAARLRLWLLLSLIVLLAVATTATASRAGFLLFMLSICGSAVLLWRRAGQGERHARLRRWLQLGAVAGLALILQYTLYPLLLRLQQDPLDDVRWQYAADTLRIAAGFHGTGLGFGSFVHAYDLLGDAAASGATYANHAHNDYAELWLEGGIPAAALMALALLAVLQQVWTRTRAHLREQGAADSSGIGSGIGSGTALGAALALLLLALHSLVDYPLRPMAMQAVVAVLVALLVRPAALSRPGRTAESPRPAGLQS